MRSKRYSNKTYNQSIAFHFLSITSYWFLFSITNQIKRYGKAYIKIISFSAQHHQVILQNYGQKAGLYVLVDNNFQSGNFLNRVTLKKLGPTHRYPLCLTTLRSIACLNSCQTIPQSLY